MKKQTEVGYTKKPKPKKGYRIENSYCECGCKGSFYYYIKIKRTKSVRNIDNHLYEKYHKEKFAIDFVEWLTSKESPYSIIYGGTPELKKDYRFATNKKDYTIEQILEKFKQTLR